MADEEIGLTDVKLESYRTRAMRGVHISAGSTLKIVNAALHERVHSARLKLEVETLKKQIASKDHELYLARVQIRALNEATALIEGRGLTTGASRLKFEDTPNPAHGDLHVWHEEAIPSCDWGGCMKPGTRARFDAQGSYGWLPVCEDCAKKAV